MKFVNNTFLQAYAVSMAISAPLEIPMTPAPSLITHGCLSNHSTAV